MLRTTTEWNAQEGAPYYTTLHFDGLTAADAAAAHDATADLWTLFAPELSVLVEANVTSDVPVVDPVTGDIQEMHTVPEVSIGGSGSGEILPWASQALIRWRTGFYEGGREIRGRTFVPGFREATSSNGEVTPSAVTGFNTVLATWLGGLPAGRTLQIWSPTNGSATNVETGTLWNQFAILRSRRGS